MLLKLALDSKKYYFCIPFSCKAGCWSVGDKLKNGRMVSLRKLKYPDGVARDSK